MVLWILKTCIEFCNHHDNQDIEQFQFFHPQELPHAITLKLHILYPQTLATTDAFSIAIVLSF